MSTRILLADDHAMLRDGLKAVLEQQSDFEVVASVADGREAVAAARQFKPDVVVMDVSMPGMNGIEATRAILEVLPDLRVLMLSMQDSPEQVYHALRAGARGYLLKDSAAPELVNAVRGLLAGRRYLSERINDALVADYLADKPGVSPLERLSPRERNILQLVVEGHSNADAAKLLHLSVKTVETYRSRLMQKLGIRDLPALVKFAIEHGVTQVRPA